MGKSISKAFKKVVGGALNTVGLGPDQKVQQVAAQDAPVAAAPVATPQENTNPVDTETSPADTKRGRRAGKRGLSVSRTSGGGISI